MSCCGSAEAREARRKDQQIDRQIKIDKEALKREVKLLLLGAGESGKSTIVKQMRIIYGEGFQDKDRAEYTPLVYQNILRSTQAIYAAMKKYNIPFADKNLERPIQLLSEIEPVSYTTFAKDVNTYKLFWADRGVAMCFGRQREYQLTDSTQYYYERLNAIGAPGYIPSTDDILRVRVPTSGIVESNFEINRTLFRFVDVGGQRSERRKWIHCFENVTSIIFIAALSEYDQTLFEDETQNRLTESLLLFDNIINYKWFAQTSVILFLNKIDIYTRKIETSNIKDYFPNFKGPAKDIDAGKSFILGLFAERNRVEGKMLYPHFTCATDTEQIKFVFLSVKDTILQSNLKDYGLM